MRIVITGGAGFIGANLCRRLLGGAGHEIVVVDDLSTGSAGNLAGLDVELIEGSILDREVLDRALHRCDAVVHLAAVPSVPRSIADPLRSHAANATGTLELLEAVRRAGAPQIVVASSSSVYGANTELPKHEALRPMPMSPYAVSKLATEAYTLAHASCFGLDALVFRFFNVFGPLQAAGHAYAAVVPSFVTAALAGRPLPVHGDGHQTRDFTYVDTVTEIIDDAIVRRVTSPDPVNLAFGSRVSLRELIVHLEQALGRPLDVESLPSRAGDVRDSQAANARLVDLFPTVTPVEIQGGLINTVRWFESLRS